MKKKSKVLPEYIVADGTWTLIFDPNKKTYRACIHSHVFLINNNADKAEQVYKMTDEMLKAIFK
jgi:hypothetical protein